jgi:hypothetical protein
LHTWEVSLPIDVFAVDDPRFLGMQFEPTLSEALRNPVQSKPGLRQTSTVNDPVIGIAAEPDARQMPGHPHIEGIVQEQIRQDRTDNPGVSDFLCAGRS